jgi:hypothetical protein
MSVQLGGPVRTDRLLRLVVAAIVVLAGIGTLLVARPVLGGDPAGFVSVTVDNPTGVDVDVAVLDERGGTLRLSRVERNSAREVREVIDQGRTWVFAFRPVGGEVHRSAPVTGDQLRAQGWRVRVPGELAPGTPPGRHG